MRRGAAHLTFVLADPARVDKLRAVLEEHGVHHAAVVAHPWSIRRSLVLGESEFVVMCIALDRSTLRRHGQALQSLLSDHRCFQTAIRTVGLLSDLGLTPAAAELGCDVYVEDSIQAARAIRLLDDAMTNDDMPRQDRLRLRAVLASTAWISPGIAGRSPTNSLSSLRAVLASTARIVFAGPWTVRPREVRVATDCYTSPWSSIAAATLTNPAILAPLT